MHRYGYAHVFVPGRASLTLVSTDDADRTADAQRARAAVSSGPLRERADASAPAVEPDLLWIESVTERLLGAAGPGWEPSTAQQIHDQQPFGETQPDEKQPGDQQPGDEQPDAKASAPAVASRFVARGYAPAVTRLDAAASPEVAPPAPPAPAADAGPGPGPGGCAGASYFAAATGQRAGLPPTRTTADPGGEEMLPGVLRAALREALPDDVGRRPRPMDAVFGDPSWRLAPEPPEPDHPGEVVADEIDPQEIEDAELGDDPLFAPRRPAAPGASARAAAPGPPPSTTAAPHTRGGTGAEAGQPSPGSGRRDPGPAASGGGHRAPKPADPADVALRRAFLSGDEELAAAVVDLVGAQGHDQQRLRLVQAYLDAVLAAGGEGLAGATRLRRLLDD